MDHHIDWTAQVRRAGLRVTSGRVAALQFLQEHPHSSAAEVFAGIRAGRPSLTVQSVHNVVNDLCQHGLLRRISLPDATGAYYETRAQDNHHHIRCVVCGAVEDVDCAVGEAPCLTPAQGHGMPVLLSAEILFNAVCASCAAEDPEVLQQAGAPRPVPHAHQEPAAAAPWAAPDPARQVPA